MWQSPRGVIIAAVRGGGAHAMRIPHAHSSAPGTDEGMEGRGLDVVRAQVSRGWQGEDREEENAENGERRGGSVLRVCISDHEAWEELPLAQGLAGMAEGRARGGESGDGQASDWSGLQGGGQALQAGLVHAEPMPLCCGR